MPKLYVLSGPDVGKSFELEAGATIGRAADCAVHLRDPSISRHHARLERVAEGWTIVDLDSRNGLVFAGARAPRATLADGAEFQLGEVLVRFRSEVSPASASSTADVIDVTEGMQPVSGRPAEVESARGDELADEVVLEGEWTGDPRPRLMDPAAPLAELAATTVSRAGAAAPLTPGAARPGARVSGVTARGAVGPSRGILQYQREPDRSGFFHADLAQQPLWVRGLVWLCALAFFAVLFWGAFRATAYLKGRAQGEPAEAEAVR